MLAVMCYCCRYSGGSYRGGSYRGVSSRGVSSSRGMMCVAPVVFLLLLLVSLPGCQGQQWDTRPQDSSVQETGTIILQCRFRDRDQRSVSWTKYKGNDAETLFIDGDRWTQEDRFSVDLYQNGDVSGYDLKLAGARKDDDAEYQCKLQLIDLEERVNLLVIVVPSRPVIILDNTGTLVEGYVLELNCSSTGGNPPPSVEWRRNGLPISANSSSPSGGEKFGTMWSVLIRSLTRNDHNTEYRCLVENQANEGFPVQEAVTLQVQYAPVISFGDYNPLRVIEDTPQTTLSCVVEAYPPVIPTTITWVRDGSVIASGTQLSLPNIKEGDAGIYQCRAENVVAETTSELLVDVQYGPKVALWVGNRPVSGQVVTIQENSRINMTCMVQANPVILAPIEWFHNGVSIDNNGPNYVIEDVLRTQDGDYTCRARNQLAPSVGGTIPKTGEQTFNMLVQYRPGRASVSGPDYAIKGQSSSLQCSLSDPGVPEARLEWTKVNSLTIIHTGPTLQFPQVALADNGDYSCTPRNLVGQGEPTTFNFIVNELPEWVQPGGQLPSQQVVNITKLGLSIACHVRGRPKPQITWYKDNQPISEFGGFWRIENDPTFADIISFDVRSTLYWEGPNRDNNKLRIEDVGVYSCKAHNEISDTALSSTMDLVIQYAPMLNSTADKVAIDINQSAILICQAHSVPSPSFVWYNGSTLLTSGGRIHITTAEVPGSHPYQSILNISDVTRHDLGNYRCVARNEIGTSQVLIHLTVKTVPDPPTQLRIISKTWESVDLEWSPGFYGGYEQWFVITYTSSRHSQYRLEVQPPQATNFNITMLYPDVYYTIKVFGENDLGGGAYSHNISVLTDYFEIQSPTDVTYMEEDRTLMFKSPSTNYCVKVDIYDGTQWEIYEKCAPATGGSIKIQEELKVLEVRVALCLLRRQDICSSPKVAEIVEAEGDDLPVSTIIIVAVICGSIVLILLLILIVLCCRRHSARKKEMQAEAAQRQIPPTANNMKPGSKGIDNPGLERAPEMVDLDDPQRTGVFSTNTSNMHPHNGNYVMFDRQRQQQQPNGHMNGYPGMNGGINGGPGWNQLNGNISQDHPPNYNDLVDGKVQRKKPNKDVINLHPPPGHHTHPGDLTKDSDSGVSTPDPTKPKKVIYEVIV